VNALEKKAPDSVVSAERNAHEVLVGHGGLPVHLGVPLAERVGQSLDLDLSHDKVVQADHALARAVFGNQVVDKGRAEPEAHLFDGGGELSHVELAAFLDVVALVGGLPLLDKGEQGPELVDVNLAGFISVEHVNHHPAGLLAEVGVVPVHQGLLQLSSLDLTAAIGVNSVEPLHHLGVHGCGWCPWITLRGGSWITLGRSAGLGVAGGRSSRISGHLWNFLL